MIDRLVESQEVSFEHELEFEVGEQPLKAVLNVTGNFEHEGIGHFEMWGHKMHDEGSLNLTGLSFQVVALMDPANNEVEMTPEISRELDDAFEAAYDTLSQRAYDSLD